MNRLVSYSLATFWISFAFLCGAVGILAKSETFFPILAAAGVLLVIVSGVTHLIAISVREAAAWGDHRWRFSVRSLLILTTVIALILGLWFYAVRI